LAVASQNTWLLGAFAGLALARASVGLYITAAVEVIPVQKINEACDRMLKSDVKYRSALI
jgi:D-arabinose 1-dehydrogenase-like Zn-dependent alcohol dehydrogenase